MGEGRRELAWLARGSHKKLRRHDGCERHGGDSLFGRCDVALCGVLGVASAVVLWCGMNYFTVTFFPGMA